MMGKPKTKRYTKFTRSMMQSQIQEKDQTLTIPLNHSLLLPMPEWQNILFALMKAALNITLWASLQQNQIVKAWPEFMKLSQAVRFCGVKC